MNIDYQHLQAQNKATFQTNQQNLQELHAENNYLRQQIIQLTNNILIQRQQWSEEHFKLQDRIEELQNQIDGLIKDIEERQDEIERLSTVNRHKNQQVVTIRSLYNSVLQQLINREEIKERKGSKINILSIEEINQSLIKVKQSKQDSQSNLKLVDLEGNLSAQREIALSQSSIQNYLHKLQTQSFQQRTLSIDPNAIIPNKPIFSLLEQLKQIKTSQTIPNNMNKDEKISSNTQFYFKYSNNSYQNRSLNSATESQKPLCPNSLHSQPNQERILDQIQEQPCNWHQTLSFFLGGMWSGAYLIWIIST